MNEEGRPTSGEKRAGGGVWLCCVWLHQLVIFYGLHCLDKALYLSRKLAVASWSYSCFRKGRGRPESNTVIFHSEPLPSPPSPLSSRGILKRSWKQMVTGSNPDRSLGNLYSAYQNPIIFQAHMHLSFRSAPRGPQVYCLLTIKLGARCADNSTFPFAFAPANQSFSRLDFLLLLSHCGLVLFFFLCGMFRRWKFSLSFWAQYFARRGPCGMRLGNAESK